MRRVSMKVRSKYQVSFLSMMLAVTMVAGCIKDGQTDSNIAQNENGTKQTGAGIGNDQSEEQENNEEQTDSIQSVYGDDVEMGRYVEKTIALPEACCTCEILGISIGDENLPAIYIQDSEKAVVIKYELQSDETWEEQALDWTDSLVSGEIYQEKVLVDGNGKEYLYVSEAVNDILCPHLYIEDEGEVKEIPMEGWSGFNECSIPENIDMMPNGILTSIVDGEFKCYDALSGELLSSAELGGNYVYEICGDSILHTNPDPEAATTGIDIYETTDVSTVKMTYEYPEANTCVPQMCFDSQGNYIAFDSNGILKSNSETMSFETVLDGEKTSMFAGDYIVDVKATSEDTFYVLAVNNNDYTYEILRYQYDETVPTYAQYYLNIYSLTDNSVIRDAIVLFQQEHPEYEFSYQYDLDMYEDSDGVSKEEYIRILNTQLLAEDGPDIIDLTGLPVQDYIVKGALADAADVIQPYLEGQDLLENVVSQFQYEGGYYAVPLQFMPVCIFGQGDVTSCNTMEEMITYAKNHSDSEKTILNGVSLAKLLEVFLPMESENLLDENGNLSEENLKNFIQNVKTLYGLSKGIESEELGSGGDSPFHLIKAAYSYVNSIVQLDDFVFSISSQYDGSFESFGGYLVPINQIGMNANSMNLEAAKEFYRYLYSEEFQMTITNSYFPVSQTAFSSVIGREEREYNENSGINVRVAEDESIFLHIIPRTQDEKDKMKEICYSVDKVYLEDETMNEIFEEGMIGYITGTDTLDDAVNQVYSKLSFYMAE